MLKNLKMPIFVSFAIIIIFLFQGFMILNLTKDDIQRDTLDELHNYANEIKLQKLDPNINIIYEYAILDKNLKVINSNLSTTPLNFNFKTLEYNNFLYYKDYMTYDDSLFFIVVAKKLSYERLRFIGLLTFLGTIFVVFFVTKITYKSVTFPLIEKTRMMNTFFNDAMHELKTPLGVASMNLEMLEYKDKHTHRIKGALRHMKVTYEDVEYFIKNERISFPKEIVNLSLFLEERIKFSSTIANVKHIEIASSIEPNLTVYMSLIEVTRLVDNNLSNALKYSNPDSLVKIILKQERNNAVFSVEDFGIGIKNTDKIWDRYEREDKTRGGFGLGLNIVLKICLKYDIAYNVESVYSKGSKFSYKIPLYKELPLDNVI